MNIFDTYFKRYQTFSEFISEQPNSDLYTIVAIPCYSETDIETTLLSLMNCAPTQRSVEIIVVVNHSEAVDETVKKDNKTTYENLLLFAAKNSRNNRRIYPIYAPNLPKKHAGVGFARKIGMDEAIRRFKKCGNNGVIAAFDADSLAQENYLQEIESYFLNNNCGVATVHYEHPLQGKFIPQMYSAIAQYELHLRLYVKALANVEFPYPFHTVGSSMAVRAEAYCKQGGMNKRQAGEDFYFLHKLFQTNEVGHVGKTTIIPSSRISHRVPFGTGHAMRTISSTQENIYYSYNPESYQNLSHFFSKLPMFITASEDLLASEYESLHETIKTFIPKAEFLSKLIEIQKNSTTYESFKKRFYNWFNGFLVFRYLNEAHIDFYKKLPIQEAASLYLQNTNSNVEDMLWVLRAEQKTKGY